MANSELSYRIVPNAISPDQLLIGHIINGTKRMKIINNGEIPPYDESCIKQFSDFDFHVDQDLAKACSVSLLAQAALQGIGIEVQFGSSSDVSQHFYVPEMRVRQARFDDSYYLRAVEYSQEVQKHLARFRGHVYMVTGVMACSQKSITIRRGKEIKASGQLGVECGPVNIGPAAQGARSTSESQQMIRVVDSIFAIQLVKLKYKRTLFGDESLCSDLYVRGAKFVGEVNEDAQVMAKKGCYQVEMIAEQDVGQAVKVVLGGQSILIALELV